MRFRMFILLILSPIAPALAADLPTTDTPVGRLALPVIADSVVVSPDSSRLAFTAKAGDPTLEEKGVFINPKVTNPLNDNARPALNPICLYIDDKSTISFDTMTLPVFSPNSKRLGFAGLHDKTWQLVLDNKTLTQDADDVPGIPIVFSPDSAHAAWVILKGQQYLLTVDDRHWPPIAASAMGLLTFSPDSRHVAAVVNIRGAWTLYVDGAPLPLPPAPGSPVLPATARSASPPSRGPVPTAPAPRFVRFGQFSWRPDSSGLAYYAGFTSAAWQLFSQSLAGTITFASKPCDGIMKNAPVFSPDARQLAFGVSTRNKWTFVTDPAPTPAATTHTATAPAPTTATAPAPSGPFDQILMESVSYYQPAGVPNQPFTLLYVAQQNKKWRLYVNDRPTDDAFDAIISGSFVLSPDLHHYAFAGIRDGQTFVIKDGATLARHNECGASTFAFSPDSQHLAYAAGSGAAWFVCVDGTPGAPFTGLGASPIAFSPDSSRVAFVALTAQKTWRLIIGKDAGLQSKPYDAFLKGSHVTWRPDGTVVTIAIQKKVATRIEARP